MKVLYSKIQELVPELKATPEEVGDILTMIGFMMDSFEKVNYQGKKDYLIGLEVRQNRADCLSVMGVAREVAAYYGLKIKLPEIKNIKFGDQQLDIKVEAKENVQRILAIAIDGLQNKPSPDWLKEFLVLHDMNSIDVLVDISNYIMLMTGYPPHIFDKDKLTGNLSWTMNQDFEKIVTLDGTEIKIDNNIMIIRDDQNPLSTMMVGGQTAAVSPETKSIIGEIAVYDGATVNRNARSLNIATEAGIRLGKMLDPNGIDSAMNMMISMILEYCGGQVASKLFDYYPNKLESKTTELNPALPSVYAGLEIAENRVIKILDNLGFEPKRQNNGLILTKPPTGRMDISLEEDLIEEVIRMVGFYNIPSDQIPKLDVIPEITPELIKLSDKIRDILVHLGLDEILSLPLVKREYNPNINYLPWQEITTQNSINEEYPNLRQSIAFGLLSQLEEYSKKNVEYIHIFEIGKVFGKADGDYQEHESLGVLFKNKNLSYTKSTLEKLLFSLGAENITYQDSAIKPQLANPYSCWSVFINKEQVGIFYKFKKEDNTQENICFFELNLERLVEVLGKIQHNPVVEITQKLIILDANIELTKDEDINQYLENFKNKIGDQHLWSMVVQDVFPLPEEKIRYTIRTTYQELSDQEAKKIHAEVFGLKAI